MRWPSTKKYFNGFRILTLLSSLALMMDQIFIRWRMDGKIQIVSLAGFLPEPLMTSHLLFQAISVLFLASGLLWLFCIQPKWTSILSVVLFIFSTSLYLQNEPFGDHRQSVFCFLLMILAAREFQLLKHYFFPVAASIVVSFYFLAGWEKIFYSGLSWVNGTSLQVFVHYMGYGNSHLRHWILQSATVAKFLQAGILILECGSIFLFGPRFLRWAWLIGLVGFHIGIEEIFAYRYFLHLFLVLYLFALPDILERRHEKNA
ncbi:MAG: hypothetical protein J7501_07070 [Bdellovibrio sp.]|nr:hypothetical protein [Bdellovibrio sp.]